MLGYSGIDGNLQNCNTGEATCYATMGGGETLYPYDVLYVNDDHTVATHYMCASMMSGRFTFSWWNVVAKTPTLDAVALSVAQNKVLEANVGYTDLSARTTEQGATCEYDWTLA